MGNKTAFTKKKKVLFIGNVPPPVTGLTLSNRHLLNSKFSSTFDVDFINCKFVNDVADTGKFRVYKLVLGIKYLARIFNSFLLNSYDVVIVNYASLGLALIRDSLFATVSSVLFRKKTVLWMHGNGLLDYDRHNVFFKRLIVLALGRAERIVVVGDNLKKSVSRWAEGSRVEAVHYGIESLFPEQDPPGSTGKNTCVLYFSNMIREKGWLVTLKAAAELKDRRDIKFVFCGAWWPHSDEQYARELVRKWGIEKNVEFRGKTIGDKKKSAFGEADVFVFPTFFPIETFGLVNLEAMSSGLPVITTSRAAIPEIVTDGINGFLIPEQDAQILADKIVYLSDNPDKRFEMGERNRERFDKLFTIEAFAERWTRLIYRIV